MRFLAAFERSLGHTVTGSDLTLSGHSASNVDGCDLVVYTSAISENNPELQRAKELGIPVVERSALLGQIAPLFAKTVAVAGTHGKTTITGMLWKITESFNPTVHIGGRMGGRNGNLGSRDLFITEACEYRRSFLNLKPDIAVVSNIELDHTDFYKKTSEVRDAFKEFVSNVGIAVINGDDPNCAVLYSDNTRTFGLSDKCNYYADNITVDKDLSKFTVYKDGKKLGNIALGVGGKHNIYNALSAVAASDILGVDFDLCVSRLGNFAGVERRFELLGVRRGVKIYSDYSHHPSEINSCLGSARAANDNKITVVFEPHTYSRTKFFASAFVEALSQADEIVLAPVFAAREPFAPDISSALIARELIKRGKRCRSFDTYCEILSYLDANIDEGIIIFMGAGDIDKAAHCFIRENSFSS